MKKLLFITLLIYNLSVCASAYRIIEPVSAKENMACWASSNLFSDYTEIVGYSDLGHVFMRSPDTSKYIVLHPFKNGAKLYGEFISIQDFEEKILKEWSFEEFVLNLDHVSKIKERLGALGEEEVYTPAPYSFLGGDESIESYSKGNIWVMLSIVGQFHGVCSEQAN